MTRAVPLAALFFLLAPTFLYAGTWFCEPRTTVLGEVTRCIGKTTHFPREVAVLSPGAFSPAAPHRVVLYLHGHNTRRETLLQVLENPETALEASIASLPPQTLVIVPHSLNRCDEFKTHLSSWAQVGPFLEAVTEGAHPDAGLASANPGSLLLAGHSGAYAPLASLVQSSTQALPSHFPQVERLVLLDATYGRSEVFSQWIKNNPRAGFWSAYIPASQTESESLAIQTALRNSKPPLPYFAPVANDGLPPSPATVMEHRVGFLKSRSSHMKTVATYFSALLAP